MHRLLSLAGLFTVASFFSALTPCTVRPQEPTAAHKQKLALDAELPAASRHSFGPVDKRWIKTVSYEDEIFRTYRPEDLSEEQKKRLSMREVYSATGQEKGNYRVVVFYPSGTVHSVRDYNGKDQFSQEFHRNGALSRYLHLHGDKWLNGYSLTPDGKEVHRLIQGKGKLKVYGEKPGDVAYFWYHDGMLFLRTWCEGGKLDYAHLSTPDGETLSAWRQGEEQLKSTSDRMWYTRTASGNLSVVKLASGKVERLSKEVENAWKAKYQAVRKRFFDRFERFLMSAGYSSDELGIEFLRKEAAWPK